MKFKSIILSAAALITFSSFSYSQTTTPTDPTDSAKQERPAGKRGMKHRGGKHGGDRHGRGKMAMRGLKDLNLSDSQKAEFKAMREANMARFQPQREEMKALAGKKRDGIITAEEESRFKTLREEMRSNGKASHDAMINILTPEQKTQLEQKRNEMRERMKERKGMRNGKKPEVDEVKSPETLNN